MFKLKKPAQKNLVLVKVSRGKESEIKEYSQKMFDQSVNKVKVESSFGFYGSWNSLLVFRAKRKVNSLNFMGEVLRSRRVMSKINSSPVALLFREMIKRRCHCLVSQLFLVDLF